MYSSSSRGFTSDRYGHSAGDAFDEHRDLYDEDETRRDRLGHLGRHRRRYDDDYEYRDSEAQYERSSRVRRPEYYDARDPDYFHHHYHHHQTHEGAYEGTWRHDRDGHRRRADRHDRGGDEHPRDFDSRKETKTFLAGPSLLSSLPSWNIPQRLHSSSPPPQPISSSPSPEYLKIVSEPSQQVSSPPRKLIILDLNGTLLVRVRSLGAIYPRPYMSAFRDYLLCPATRKWLDVMVWSSAQPHNVERMVRRCFFDPRLGEFPPGESDVEDGEGRFEVEESEDGRDDTWHGKLVAVWARDTLGLTQRDYSRKSQTTKDLDKPWSSIPGNHGPQTTVLLDDSPRKARLQPFNHVCINEYLIENRERDKALKKQLRRRGKQKQAAELAGAGHLNDAELQEKPCMREGEHHEQDPSHEQERAAGEGETLTDRQKARKKKKEEKKLMKKRQEEEEEEEKQTQNSSPNENENDEYDSALLAIIGILDALKQESNVAGWIRAGGLWGGKIPPRSHRDYSLQGHALQENGERERERGRASPTDLEVEVNDDKEERREEGGEGGQEEKRPVSPGVAKRQRSLGFDTLGSVGGDSKRTKFGENAKAKANGDVPEPEAETEEPRKESKVLEERIIAGNDAETVGTTTTTAKIASHTDSHNPPPPPTHPQENGVKPADKDNVTHFTHLNHDHEEHERAKSKMLWFEDEETFRTWVQRGRRALRELGIEERDGIHID